MLIKLNKSFHLSVVIVQTDVHSKPGQPILHPLYKVQCGERGMQVWRCSGVKTVAVHWHAGHCENSTVRLQLQTHFWGRVDFWFYPQILCLVLCILGSCGLTLRRLVCSYIGKPVSMFVQEHLFFFIKLRKCYTLKTVVMQFQGTFWPSFSFVLWQESI